MSDETPAYEVAFSFTQKDEPLATELNDLLAERFSTFIYFERQKEIAGKDGQDAFSEVYGGTARIVVVLYRSDWGQTRWTTVESTAIRTRAFEDGFDFTVFIPTEPGVKLPKWLPPTRLYVGLERWGVKGAAAVIEQRVIDAGGVAREETAVDRAARSARRTAFAEEKHQYFNSEKGVAEGEAAYQALWSSLEALAEEMSGEGVQAQLRDTREYRIVSLGSINLIMHWQLRYSNTLDETRLTATFYKGFPELPGFYPSYHGAVKLRSEEFTHELVRSGEAAYVGSSNGHPQFTPQKLADELMRHLMDFSDKNPVK